MCVFLGGELLCYLWKVISFQMKRKYRWVAAVVCVWQGDRRADAPLWNNLWGFSAHKLTIVCHQDEFRRRAS